MQVLLYITMISNILINVLSSICMKGKRAFDHSLRLTYYFIARDFWQIFGFDQIFFRWLIECNVN